MSLLFTESFMAYPRWTGGVGSSAPELTARVNYMANNSVFGVSFSGGTNYYLCAIAADPLYPDRNACWLNFATGGTIGNYATFRVPLDQDSSRALVCGFSVYLPSAVTTDVQPTLSTFEIYIGSKTSGNHAFDISRDGRFYDASGATQSSKRVLPDTQGYVEFRYYRNELRVWFDDVLVLQKTGLWGTDLIEIRMLAVAAGSTTKVFCFSNFYALLEDAVMPNVRLGPTTRVIGRRPNADVQAQWLRSAGASNAAVAAQDPSVTPTNLLQTDTAGSADFYSPAVDATTQGATLIHAVATRALVGNVDSVGHAFDAGVRVGTDVDYGDTFAASSFQKYTQPWGSKAAFCALGRTNGRLLIGGTGPMLYVLKHSGAAPLGWVSVFDSAGATWFVSIVENSVGRLFALTSDGLLYTCAPGADETVQANWTTKTTPGTATWRKMVVGPSDHLVAVKVASGFAVRSIDDGTTWVAGNQPGSRTAVGLLYANGQYVMVNNYIGPTLAAYTSVDGLAWTTRTVPAVSWPTSNTANIVSIAYGNGVYVAVGGVAVTTGDLWILVSPDAITWSKVNTILKPVGNLSTGALTDVAFVDGRFIAAGNSAPVMSSVDGINWEEFLITGAPSNVSFIATTPDGYVIGWSTGVLRRFTKNNEKTLVESLQNKVLWRVSALNPQTDIAWAGAEAAAAEFGMKLTT